MFFSQPSLLGSQSWNALCTMYLLPRLSAFNNQQSLIILSMDLNGHGTGGKAASHGIHQSNLSIHGSRFLALAHMAGELVLVTGSFSGGPLLRDA